MSVRVVSGDGAAARDAAAIDAGISSRTLMQRAGSAAAATESATTTATAKSAAAATARILREIADWWQRHGKPRHCARATASATSAASTTATGTATALRRASESGNRCDCTNWLETLIPAHGLNASDVARCWNRQLTHCLARRIADAEKRVRERLLEMHLNHCVRRWILAREELMTPELVVAIVL